MRWVLAGLSFAMLISLAVLTVAIKARNIEARRRIAQQDEDLMALKVELARRERSSREATTTEELEQRLLDLLLRDRGGSQ